MPFAFASCFLKLCRETARQFDKANTSTFPKNCGGAVCSADVPVVNPTIDITKNRLNGYTYDSAGNTTKDAQSRKFTYDAENK